MTTPTRANQGESVHASNVVSLVILLQNVPIMKMTSTRKEREEEKEELQEDKGRGAYWQEWDSNCSSSDSDDEGLVAFAFDKSSLFPNKRHTCLMAKEKKLHTRDTPKYTSSDEDSDDDLDYSDLFKGLDRSKVDQINELIDALNEKDWLLEKQEDILYEGHDKFVNVEKSLALEIKKNEMIALSYFLDPILFPALRV
jgi:hypothetical protein